MATVRATVNGALRKIGRLASGREARAVDAEDAFEALKSLYRGWINQGTFGRLWDVIPTADYTAYPGQRVFVQDDSITITLPTLVPNCWWGSPWEYGSRWVPPTYNDTELNNTTPRDGAVVVICNDETGIMADFIYDGAIKRWMGVNGVLLSVADSSYQPMTLDSEAPLSVRDPLGLQSCLAVAIADQWGAEIQPTTARQSAQFEMALTHGFSNPERQHAGIFI